VLYFFLQNAVDEEPLRISRPAGHSVPSVAGSNMAIGGLEDRRMFGARNSNLLHRNTNPLIIYCLVTVVLCVHTAAALPGSGTQQDPWRIESLSDFDEFAVDPNYWSGFTRLETDVNLAGRTYSTAVIAPDTSTSSGFQGIKFTGVFDGNDYVIRNTDVHIPGSDYVGLFGYLGTGGQIKNLGVMDISIVGRNYVGGLVGANGDWYLSPGGAISNCYSNGDVSGENGVGGLVGHNWDGNISNCYSNGDVSGEDGVGGLLGGNGGDISDCYSTGDVNGHTGVGGLVGVNGSGGLAGPIPGYIFNSYSTGDVSGHERVGGLVGENCYGSISNCYSIGDVNGVMLVGGLVGYNECGISNCYSTGDVNGTGWSIGGLVGWNYYGDIVGSFWDVNTSDEPNSAGGTGKTTAEMQTKSTFTSAGLASPAVAGYAKAGWDFVEIWGIGENQTYPYLRFAPAGDFNYDKKVDLFDLAILAEHWLENTP